MRSNSLHRALFVSVASLAMIAGCGSSDNGTTENPGDSGVGADTSVADSGARDTATTDSATTDSGKADSANADTGSTTDSGKADSGTADSAVTDSATTDSAVTDTASTDTAIDDTATSDTATATDTATTSDTATADTAPVDVGTDTGPTLDAACTSWANDYCTRYDTCTHFFIELNFGDVATCKSRVKLSCVDLLGAPGVGYTPTSIEACGTAYTTQSCSEFMAGRVPTACAVPGTYINGHACGANAQCASDFCHITSGTCGTCAAPPTEGAACMDGQCAEGMNCIGYTGTAGTGLCQKPGLLGDSCDATNKPCGPNLSCRSGSCVADATAGTTCSLTSTAPDCDVTAGLYCDDAGSHLCKLYGTATAGGSCGDLPAGKTACVAAGTCVASASGSTTGTCEASAADGATCSDTTGPTCMAPAVCLGSCTISDPSSCH